MIAVLRLVMLLLGLAPAAALSHALEPGYLEIRALGGDNFQVHWARPDVQGRPMQIDARLSEPCSGAATADPRREGRAWVVRWRVTCPGGLAGTTVTIDGLEKTQTDVLARYELEPGQGQSRRLTPQNTAFKVPANPGIGEVLASYFALGVDHILFGVDHLLFVFALLLLIRERWVLFGAVTAFTVAHSITLAAAALGWTRIPGPPVEAVIALSIMFLASELLHRDPQRPRLSERAPWVVSFLFGLIHGLGFGSALQEIGLPDSEVVVALLAFNVGVEAGQIVFILAVLSVAELVRRVLPRLSVSAAVQMWTGRIGMPYAIGGVAAFWLIERIAAF